MARPLQLPPAAMRWSRRGAAWLARRMPLALLRALARTIGGGWMLLDPAGRRTVSRNLRALVPDRAARARCVAQSFASFAQDLAERPLLDAMDAHRFAGSHLRVVDPWRVFAAKPLAGPAIIVAPHCHWEHLAAALKELRLAAGVTAIVRSTGDAAQDAADAARLERLGIATAWLDRAPLAALRLLRAGGVLGILADRDYSGHARPVRAFGGVAALPPGPAALAVQTGAPIIPLHLARVSADRLQLTVLRPIRADPAAPRPAETARLQRLVAAALTRSVAAAPGQWVAFHTMVDRPVTGGR